jgi:type IX secretion system PorP/SprF family membrane protein
MYTQYLFNKAGMNPAASGTDINTLYYYAFGASRQWVAFDNAPKQNFVNFSYTIRPPRAYRYWQNVSVYLDNDDTGILGNVGAYCGYTLHMLLHRKYVLSFGVYAGLRRYSRSVSGFDNSDPAVQKNASSVLVYPDIIPGVRFSGKKTFCDLSARQITINKIQDFKGKKFGSPSLLLPNIYFDMGRLIALRERLMFVPSFAVNLPLVGPPSVDVNVMYYYANRVGLGAAVRNIGFISGILQVRFLENVTAGFAYSYPLNSTRIPAPHSYEIMIGMVPFGMDAKATGKHSVARCPTLNY